MKILKAILSILAAGGLIFLLSKPLGGLPALGSFFSPFTGFLQNSESKASFKDFDLKLEGLKAPVEVSIDDLGIPHIFAQNDEDLYMTQGYLLAKDRLWQMEFYPRVAAGRLTEMVGEKALEFDRYNRHLGMAETARQIVENLSKDPKASIILNSYAAGVNAYIKGLSSKTLPVEYKFFGTEPETWTPEKSILLLMAMRNTLNGGSSDFAMAETLAKYGKTVVNDLFPDYPVLESPIIPEGTPWNFKGSPVTKPNTEASPVLTDLVSPVPIEKPEIGSNNFAVSGSKTVSGMPILANDPHLTLSLPSIWYQVQLHAPGINSYGVCLPGAPGIVIGFNENIAWGVTNTGSDVMDFYHIQFKDTSMNQYLHDGKWLKTTKKPQQYFVKGQKEPIRDTIIYTHHGPIVTNPKTKPFNLNAQPGMAMKWVCNEATGNDLLAFYKLNRAKTHADYRDALLSYTAPAQNFIFASNQNDIAITPNGKLPIKWKGQGKYVLDGTDSKHDWQGWIPADQNPTVKNPARGFVSSANQFPTDQKYPYYLGWSFASPERGLRINQRLEKMEKATADSLRLLQGDNWNLQAERLLPVVLKEIAKDPKLAQNPGYKELAKWNFVNDATSVGAAIFETWINILMEKIWDEFKIDNKPNKLPSRNRTIDLITKNPGSIWFDNQSTKNVKESMNAILVSSMDKTIDSLTAKFGPISPETWQWKNVKSTSINHLVPALKGFGRHNIANGGGANSVNATTATTGPSWRMVVQLSPKGPEAYGLFPGGQSGNPGSKHYDNMIEKWTKGELNPLVYLKTAADKNDRIVQHIKISK